MGDSGRLGFSDKLVEEALACGRERAWLAAQGGLLDLALHVGAAHEARGWRYSGLHVP